MRWLGDGPTLWRVRVTLKAGDAQLTHKKSPLERLRYMLAQRPGETEPCDLGGEFARGDVDEPTIGASFWVRADDIGAAAQLAVAAMTSTLEAVTGQQHGVHEVNLVPHDAVVTSPSG